VRVLVTGGSGFIGSHVVDRLMAHGHEPRIFDLVASPHHEPGEVDTVLGDLLDLEAVRAAVRGCDAVVHLAAVADVNRVADDPSYADLVNVRGTGLLLEAARGEGVPRVLYASTIWVYGGMARPEPAHEESPLALPDHFYTATKLAGEMYCRAYNQLYGLGYTILRFGIPHGPRTRQAAVVARFVAHAMAGEALSITGDGSQSRQFVYVEDLAEGVVAALAPWADGRVYNLVGRESVSVRAIAETVRRVVREVPIVHVASRPADLGGAEISGARAEQELSWRARTPFDDGVRRYVAWLTAANGNGASAPAAAPERSPAPRSAADPAPLPLTPQLGEA
jgi:UDP-glucose 4-epimerase